MNIALGAGLEIIIVAIFLICILLGKRMGLIKSLVGLLGTVAAIVIAFIFSAQLGGFINNNYVEKPMTDWVANQLTSAPSGSKVTVNEIDLDKLFDESPEFFVSLLDNFGINKDTIKNEYESAKNNGIEQAKSATIENITKPIAATVSRVLAFLIIFIGALIVFKLLFFVVGIVAHIPIIRKFDALGGVLFGVVKALLIVFIAMTVIKIIYPYTVEKMSGYTYKQVTEKTIIYKTISNFNPLSLSDDE